ncbi:guanine nucleotide exchange factor MON1 SCDLUD_000998 [Saccharomycodes ludwigii]|uniref:guanine nucleotide exchange factor MON1 n=1 Tax=Saccharomycodes ludwigii TaxID=36035 RepID=UPI001E829F19|nr:hypothetical protein SCDLUD_000998 [Saccharomycodes ludwigii]KAH3903369.1 hypothetical protein SCDLUD_000998 [Saccharomycodes ludwigii]
MRARDINTTIHNASDNDTTIKDPPNSNLNVNNDFLVSTSSIAQPITNTINTIYETSPTATDDILDLDRNNATINSNTSILRMPSISKNLNKLTDDLLSINSNVTALTSNLQEDLLQSIYSDTITHNNSNITTVNTNNSSTSTNRNINDAVIMKMNDVNLNRSDDLFLKLPDLLPHTVTASDNIGNDDVCHFKKNFFILSSAGKPIYSMHGSDEQSINLMGVIHTLVEFFKINKNCDLKTFEMNSKSNTSCKFTFLNKHPIVLMAHSTNPYETELHLLNQLDFLYSYLLSILSKRQLDRLFSKRENFDLRNFLNQENFQNLNSICNMICNEFHPEFLFYSGSLQVYPMKKKIRDKLHTILLKCYVNSTTVTSTDNTTFTPLTSFFYPDHYRDLSISLLYGMITLVERAQLVSVLRPKGHTLHTTDLHLLFQLIKSQYLPKYLNHNGSTNDTGSNDLWVPVCFPKFNSNGFLYCFIKFFTNEPLLGPGCFSLILISAKKDSFQRLKTLGDQIISSMEHLTLNKILSKTITATGNGINGSSSTSQQRKIHRSYSSSNLLSNYGITSNVNYDIPTLNIVLLPPMDNVYHFIYKSKNLVQHISPPINENLMDYYLYLQKQCSTPNNTSLANLASLDTTPNKESFNARNSNGNMVVVTQLDIKRYDVDIMIESYNDIDGYDTTTGKDTKPGQSQSSLQIYGVSWITTDFELYLLGNPYFLNKRKLLQNAKEIIYWCKKNEPRIFIKQGAVF